MAAVDLGTNTCRLLVARPGGAQFEVVDSFSRIVRLGEGLEVTGRLSEAAIERTIRALHVCASKVRMHGVRHIKGVATEACRRAENGQEFLNRAARETGLTLEPIPPEEEVKLTLAGCAPLIDPSASHALMFDIGGGSTEVTWIGNGENGLPKPIGMISAPHGVVSLVERFGCEPLSENAYNELTALLEAHFAPFDEAFGVADALDGGNVQVLGTSGTVTTLGALWLGLERYDRSQVDGLEVSFEAVIAIARRLASMTCRERGQIPCIGKDRADLVLVGCAILEAFHRRWPAERLRIADRGIREGLLAQMIAGLILSQDN